jgi:hypothetical protein
MADDGEKGGGMSWLTDLFDAYSLKARVLPVVLVLAPILLLPFVLLGSQRMAGFALVGVIAAALLFPVTGWVRERAKKQEPTLYSEWHGKPTTRMLFWHDPTIDAPSKERYYKFFRDNEVHIPTPEEQKKNPAAASTDFDSAVKFLIENRRGNTLVLSENASYGFRRNLYPIRWIGVATAIIAGVVNLWRIVELIGFPSVTSFADFWNQVEFENIAGLVVDILFLIFFATRSKPWIKRAADIYAVALLKTCDRKP